MQHIEGGVTAAKGFKASGVHCGIRKNKQKKDLSLIVSDRLCTAACCYTQNLVKGAPILVTKQNVGNGYAQAIICNSGNANTCNANGVEIATDMCKLIEKHTGIKASDVIVASTGVIGQPMDIAPIANGMEALVAALSENGSGMAAEGIMTTDTVKKEAAVTFTLGGKTCTLGGISKGSGMIHPNMATMLCFVTSDAAISQAMIQKALSAVVKDTFNMLSIDGDTSTNDMVSVLCSGACGNSEITCEGADYEAFKAALFEVLTVLTRMMAKDGEGATKLVTCYVSGGKDEAVAKKVARSVISSNLVKAMMFGADANCGRVLCAAGYASADVDVSKIDVSFHSVGGTIDVCKDGNGIAFDEEKAKTILTKDEVDILISLRQGEGCATAWGCDLTYDYVKINGDYRT